MYCIEDYITVSPARSVFHPRIKLHQNENLWNTKLHYYWQATNQRTIANPITDPIENKLWNHTWSVGRRLKSLGGFVITYLLPGASGPALLSRNLQGKYSNHCGTHFQVAKVLPNFKLPKSFQRMLLLKFIQVCWGKNSFTFVQWSFFYNTLNFCGRSLNLNLLCKCVRRRCLLQLTKYARF